jgi:ankyrin
MPELYENFEQFDHAPLNSPTSIRLLRWQGREDLGLPSFAVEEFNVEEAPPYIALSYCWGASIENQDETYSSSHQWPILCDEKVVLVGKNLHDFLQQKDPGYHKWKDIVIGGSALHYAAHRGRLEIVANLVKIGADIDSRDDTGRTALYLACEAGHLNIVEFLLSLGANTELRAHKKLSPSMYTSLHMAIAVGRIDIAEALLDGSADLEAKLKNNIGPLYHATLRGNAAMVKLLLSRGASTENEVLLEDSTLTAGTPIIKAAMNEDIASIRALTAHGANLNAVNGYGRTALHFSVAEEDLTDITMYLLQHGASPSVRSHIGWTPLHSAAAHGLPDVIAALLDAGAEIEELEEELGRNPLHLACEFDKADNVAVLLERGAQVNVHRLDDQRTPLHISAGRVSSAVVEKLMYHGAQVHALDSQSQTPLHRAALEITFGNVSDIEKPEAVAKMASGRVDSIDLLLKHGARIDDVDESHSTPLLQAARYGNLEAVSALLEAGAFLEASSDRGFTPLIVASLQNHPKVIEFLVENGARLDSQDNNGRTPLHAALHWESPDSANLLCELRSDIHATDNDGITPLHEAAFHNFADLTERMLDSGADTDAEDNNGSTPLDLAVWQGSQVCVQLLLKRGARLSKATLKRTETDLKNLEGQQAEYVANENQAHKSELHKDAVSIATESVKPDIASTETRAESPVLLAEEGGKNGG